MIFNVILYVTSGFVLGDWIFPLYSIISYIVGSKAVDFIVEGLDRSKSAMIVTNREEERARYVRADSNAWSLLMESTTLLLKLSVCAPSPSKILISS